MLEMLRKKLIDAGIDPAVGSMDYWGTELEGVLLDMYDLGAASERESCAALVEADGRVHEKAPDFVWRRTIAKLIRLKD
jgi:hypothetical protein